MTDSISSRLALYSAATGLLAAGSAQAAPVQSTASFTLVNEVENTSVSQLIDIDGDGTDDFQLQVILRPPGDCNFGETGEVVLADAYGGNTSYYAGLVSGDPIAGDLGGSGESTYNYLTTCSGGYGSETFPSAGEGTRGFVGVSFQIDGATHYGYLELEVRQGSLIADLISACYNDNPGDPIAAGACVREVVGVPIGGLIPLTLGVLTVGAFAVRRRRRQH
ncbi:hypothetical protein [Haliea sp.]